MPTLGAHMSIAGGYYKAVVAAAACGMDTVQIFTKNSNQWRAKPLSVEDVSQFRAALQEQPITKPLAHASYLINLATPDDALWQKSRDSLDEELQRAAALGAFAVVVHPGAFMTSSDELGLSRVAVALNEIYAREGPDRADCLLENTAGQGTCLGWRLEHLGLIRAALRQPERVGVCLDTCHLFAAGYPFSDPADFRAMLSEIDKHVGLSQVRAWHLNDSVKPLGSRVDRHAAIGKGQIGLEAFRHVLGEQRFANVPMYLETPKGTADGVNLDVLNMQALRDLCPREGRKRR